MKTLTSFTCTIMLILAISATSFAKSGVISTTRTGTISTTKTGVISTTRTGTISTTGVIPTTSTSTATATHPELVKLDRFAFVELLWSVFGIW